MNVTLFLALIFASSMTVFLVQAQSIYSDIATGTAKPSIAEKLSEKARKHWKNAL